jgi:hypothetical protein
MSGRRHWSCFDWQIGAAFAGDRPWASSQAGSAINRFINRQHIERYRRLANQTTKAAERLQVMKSLAEEEARFKLEFKMPPAIARRGVKIVSAFLPGR